jgi:hypothetical protein
VDDVGGVGDRLQDYHRPVERARLPAARAANLILLLDIAAFFGQSLHVGQHLFHHLSFG